MGTPRQEFLMADFLIHIQLYTLALEEVLIYLAEILERGKRHITSDLILNGYIDLFLIQAEFIGTLIYYIFYFKYLTRRL